MISTSASANATLCVRNGQTGSIGLPVCHSWRESEEGAVGRPGMPCARHAGAVARCAGNNSGRTR